MPEKITNSEYLCDLAERLMHIPVTYGTDQGDVDTLRRIAHEIEHLDQLPDPEKDD